MSALESSIERIAGASGARARPAGIVAALAALVLALVAVLAPGAASGSLVQSPQWTLTSRSDPTYLPPGGSGVYRVEVKNTGGVPSDGSQITVGDLLPAGLTAKGNAEGIEFPGNQEVQCTGLTCTYKGVILPGESLFVTMPVEVAAGAPASVTNLVSVSGGGAPEVTRETPTTISSGSAPFGIAAGSTGTSLSTPQAGAHSDLTTTLAFNTDSLTQLSGAAKESGLELPPGFVIDVADAPKCPISVFSEQSPGFFGVPAKCSIGSQVGTATLQINFLGGLLKIMVPLYNLSTNPGEIAKIGFYTGLFGVQGTITIRPGDYGGVNTFQTIKDFILEGVAITVWGVPAAPVHNPLRGLKCVKGAGSGSAECEHESPPEPPVPVEGSELASHGFASNVPPLPYFTNMTACTGEPEFGRLFADSWEEPGNRVSVPTSFGTMVGCNLMEFGPYITAAPDTTRADTPAGFSFDVKVPQEGLVSAGGLSSADIENTVATLPQGVVINPGQAAGLAACQFSQDGIGVNGPPECPSNSKVGEVEVESPLIKRPLKGPVYLLASNPPEIKLDVAPEDPQDGIYVKFVGTVHLNETTGQLVTTFQKTPELPFTNLRLSFSGGAQAALATPTGCGIYQTKGLFGPWSGIGEVLAASSFEVESGPDGSPCESPLPFHPELIAGSTTDQAGGFTGFSVLLQRGDGQQRIKSLQFKVPEGLLGEIAKVPLCGEPQAADGTCSAASQIGHTVVEAGPGPYPLVVPQPGKPPAPIYLTGSYKGAPYGLSIVVPLEVGPFVLETQIVRAKVEVNPLTAELTVTTDPFPSIINGVPSDLREIDAVIDKPEFMFNPTSCAPMAFSGTAYSLEENVAVPISSHFQMGSCQALKFQPNFKVYTSGHTSKEDGASLTAEIVYPTGHLGFNQASSQSNVKLVKVELPKQLPSRLTTLQKACAQAVFEANPAGCPKDSVVGMAKALTPVLPVPLEGPAYFVSNGAAKFPELVVVLQGYGTTVMLRGETYISEKTGITSSTFHNIPDVPIGLFELQLPEGPYSALAANGNLCKSSLSMPTEFIAQNGAEIHTHTPVAVTGCPKARKAKASRAKASRARASRAHSRERAARARGARTGRLDSGKRRGGR
jgi:uncharacterized repeat protein (TIGR01451 family)